jgi:PII-like signaling protein
MSLTEGRASRLTMLLHADARWHHHSLSDEIIHRARDAGLAGASRFNAIEGYGRSRVLHTDVDPDIMEGLPCAVVKVDPSEERLRSFFEHLGGLLDHGVAFLDAVEVTRVFGRRREAQLG